MGRVTGARVPGFLPQEVTQSFHPPSLQSRTCPQEDPVPARVAQPLSPGVRPEQGVGAGASSQAHSPLLFPLLKWEERNRVDRPPLIFFACKTGSWDAANVPAGVPGCLDFRSPDVPGRMWLSLGEILIQPCPDQPLLTPRPPPDDILGKGPPSAPSTCQLLSDRAGGQGGATWRRLGKN